MIELVDNHVYWYKYTPYARERRAQYKERSGRYKKDSK